jgi:hypothetical protein
VSGDFCQELLSVNETPCVFIVHRSIERRMQSRPLLAAQVVAMV